MQKTMKAAVLREIGAPLHIENLEIPTPGHGEVLIRVSACGVCHSDLHAVHGDWADQPNLPLIPGHEVTGHIASCGPGVSHFDVGDAVGVPWMYSACGTCEFCLAGMETICPAAESTGYSKPGGYAEYMIAPAAFVARVPADADLHALAPILCAGVTTYRGIKRSGAQPGQWIAIIGAGGLGHVAVQYAVAMGLRVAAVDVDPGKLALAREHGAEVTVDARQGAVESLREQVPGGVHAALVTAVATQAFEQSIGMLRPGGTTVFVGLPGGDADIIRASISAIAGWELSIRGSSVGTRQDLDEAIAFAVRGKVQASVTRAKLEDINQLLDAMHKGSLIGRHVLAMD